MSTDIVPHTGGGAVVVHDPDDAGLPAGNASVPPRTASAYAALDSQLCEGFWKDVGAAGITDRRLKPVVQAAFDKAVRHVEAQEQALDEHECASTRAVLRAEWGANYAASVKSIVNFVNTEMPGALADAIWGGRDADGRYIGNNPVVMRWLLTLARGEAKPVGDINGEIAEIERTMRTNRTRYNRDPQMQARYLELISMRTR